MGILGRGQPKQSRDRGQKAHVAPPYRACVKMRGAFGDPDVLPQPLGMQPRESYYAFVHHHLRDVALLASEQVWHVLTSPASGAWLTSRWLAVGGNIDEARCVAVMGQYQIGDYSVLLLAMPQPLFPTEAHHVALARDSAGTLRYFVMEKAATAPMDAPRAFASEWCAGGARMRYGDLPAITS